VVDQCYDIGSGGVLSHAPRRAEAAFMMLDAYQPEGVTMLAVDSIFMMPHLGVLSSVHDQAATEVFDKDCIIYLGTCFAPTGDTKPGEKAMHYKLELETGENLEGDIAFGEVKMFPYGLNDKKLPLRGTGTITPHRNMDMGSGKGRQVKGEIYGGVVGIVLDGRGRPIKFATDRAERVKQLDSWTRAFNAYPERKGGAR